MADTSTLAPPASGDAAPAARNEGEKTNRRSRGGRGGKNRATAGERGTVHAENDAKDGKPANRPPKKPKQPRNGGVDNGAPAKAADAAGEATSEAKATTGDAKPSKQQPREKKPRERKPKATTAKDDGTSPPPPAPVPREVKAAKKRKPTKHEPRTQDAAEEEATTPPSEDATTSKQKRNKKQPKADDEGDAEPEEEDAEAVVAVDWSTAAWFSGCDADLGTGYWLLMRAHACNDVVVLESESLVRRAVVLQKLLTRLKTEMLPKDDLEEDSETMSSPKDWTTEEIMDAVVAAIPQDKSDTTATTTTKKAAVSMVVSLLEGEVIDAATELLISRVGREDLDLLTRWVSHLTALLPAPATPVTATGKADGDKAKADDTHQDSDDEGKLEDADAVEGSDNDGNDGEQAELTVETPDGDHAAGDETAEVVLPPPRQRSRRTTGSVNNGIVHAKAQAAAAIAFHRAHAKRSKASTGAGAVNVAWAAQWTLEIQRIFEATHVAADDEAVRKNVASQIQAAFRRSPNWRQYEVLLFGSSMSKFGSKASDLDLCLRTQDVNLEEAKSTMSVRELKLRMRRTQQQQNGELPLSDGTTRNDDASFLQELVYKSLKTAEELANSVKKQRRKTGNKTNPKIQRLIVHHAHWKALVVALKFFYDKLAGSAMTKLTTHQEAAAAAAAYIAAVRKQQKQRQKDIYAAAALLGRHGCHVDLVVAQARVPVIGFTHTASGLECDLCFDNYHACINTLLLRTYAEFDDRARCLGLAVKHWAKRRGVNDASIGYLSSYSFILLVIYFLQHKARLLPNLQHPELLRVANVPPVKLNSVDVSYCGDIAAARKFHAATHQEKTDGAVGVGDLLLSFFRFYVEEFDFSQHVVSVRHPEQIMHKRERWTQSRLKAWRVSIEDPLEMHRDLGSVLQFRCQQRIVEELKRALDLLRDGQSFETTVCEAHASTKKNEGAKKDKKKPTNKRDSQPKKAAGQAAKDAEKEKQNRGGRNGKKTPVADGARHERDTHTIARDAASDDKKAKNRAARRTDSLKPAAGADTSVSNPNQGERQSQEHGEKGPRRARGGESSKPKDASSAAPATNEA